MAGGRGIVRMVDSLERERDHAEVIRDATN